MQAVTVFVSLALLAAGRGPTAAGGLEYEVKAAFVYNFAKFVEWPVTAFDSPTAPLTICVVGADPFGKALEDTVVGEHLDGHPLAVAHYQGPPPPTACQVVFVSASEQEHYPALVAAIDPGRSLTVGDTISFLDAGGLLAFYLDNGKVRFAVNSDRAGAGGLKVSSKLLRVAMPHKPRPGGGQR